MSFRTKTPAQEPTPTPPQVVASPTEGLASMARRRRIGGGRNAFAPSAPSSAAKAAALPSVTGVAT